MNSRLLRRRLAASHVFAAAAATGCLFANHASTVAESDLAIGPVSFLADTITILTELGHPLRRVQRINNPVLGFLEEWIYDELTLNFYHGDRWRCSRIDLLGPSWSTHRGLKVGDTVQRVRALYGNNPVVDGVPSDTIRWMFHLQGAPDRWYGLYVKIADDTVRSIVMGRLSFIFL